MHTRCKGWWWIMVVVVFMIVKDMGFDAIFSNPTGGVIFVFCHPISVDCHITSIASDLIQIDDTSWNDELPRGPSSNKSKNPQSHSSRCSAKNTDMHGRTACVSGPQQHRPPPPSTRTGPPWTRSSPPPMPTVGVENPSQLRFPSPMPGRIVP